MLDRLKRALVESFVGAIALGYLLAQGILHFVNIFASPIAGWVSRSYYKESIANAGITFRSALQLALPELVRFFLVFVVFYILLRWLYFKPLEGEPSGPVRETGEAV